MSTQGLLAGTAAIDITPALGVRLGGYPHAPRHNTGAHDALSASCLYLESGGTRLCLISADLLSLSRRYILQIRQRVQAACGIPAGNIMVCCTHSHSCPAVAGNMDIDSQLEATDADPGYAAEVVDKLAMLAVSACRTAFPAQLGFAKAPCGPAQGVGGNRRDSQNGPADPFVYTLAVKDLQGAVRCVAASYALHPTLLHADNTLCSADYPGYLRQALREGYPQAEVLFFLGAAGDQSSRYFRTGQTFEEAQRFGRTIAAAAKQAVDGADFAAEAALTLQSTPFCPALRSLAPLEEAEREMAEKRAVYDALVAQNAPYLDRQNAHLALFGAESRYGYAKAKADGLPLRLVEDELPAELCLLRAGDTALLLLPGEIFSGVALAVRRDTGADGLMVCTLANGYLPGYLYTPEELAHGGYEVDVSLLEVSNFDTIVNESVRLVTGR